MRKLGTERVQTIIICKYAKSKFMIEPILMVMYVDFVEHGVHSKSMS